MMKNHWLAAAALAGLAVVSPGSAQPVAGTTTIGVVAEELQQVYSGWSVKKQILGQPVYNDTGEKVGKVDDLVIAPDKKVSYAIVGAGGFLGIGRHDVVIPVNQFKRENGKLVLPGATKEAIKAMPQFEWAK
jgi:sporulation protein YlmC with PRC-barrel domain